MSHRADADAPALVGDPVAQRPAFVALGPDRALAVLHEMAGLGVPAKSLSAAGFGPYSPMVANDSPENLVCLCASCHIRWHKSVDQVWRAFMTSRWRKTTASSPKA